MYLGKSRIDHVDIDQKIRLDVISEVNYLGLNFRRKLGFR